MGFLKKIGKRLTSNVMKDVNYIRGEGADEKADMLYAKIKTFLSGGWNIMIDKIVNLLLKSAEKDVNTIIKECKAHGVDPFERFPANLRDKLKKNYSM